MISFAPLTAALRSTIRIVGSGFTGVSTVTLGGRPVSFVVESDTDIVVSIPRDPHGITVDTDSLANLVIGAEDPIVILLGDGRGSTWITPAPIADASYEGGRAAAYANVAATFAGALGGPLLPGTYTMDIGRGRNDDVALIAPDTTDLTIPPTPPNNGNWQVSQTASLVRFPEALLRAGSEGSGDVSIDLPPGALAFEYDLSAADIWSSISGLDLSVSWDSPPFPGGGTYGFAQNADGDVGVFDVFYLPDASWGDPDSSPSVGFTDFSGMTSWFARTLSGGGLTTPELIAIDPAELTDDTFGSHYTAKRFSFVIAPDIQVTATEPSWTLVGTEKIGFVAAGPIFRLNYTWQPPRQRALFPLKGGTPTRQWPRDDALGGSPRQNDGSRSMQATPRHGVNGTYI